MLTKVIQIFAIALIVIFTTSAWAYDYHAAAGYDRLFEPAVGMEAGKALHLIKPEKLVEDLKKGKNPVVLDVRTPAESAMFGMTLSRSLAIPINALFKKQNLDRLPTDRDIVVICASGVRASMAGMALRHVGFENVYILKGGFKALAAYLNPATAYAPLAE
jgi:rhodanese-related sulfurtransferase